MTEPQQPLPKTAEELIPGNLQRSMSYAEELAKVSREMLEQMARDRYSPLREKARNMVLIRYHFDYDSAQI